MKSKTWFSGLDFAIVALIILVVVNAIGCWTSPILICKISGIILSVWTILGVISIAVVKLCHKPPITTREALAEIYSDDNETEKED